MTHLLGLFIIIIALKLVISQNSVIAMSFCGVVDSLVGDNMPSAPALA